MSHPNDDPSVWTNAHRNPAGVTDASVDVHGNGPLQSLPLAPVEEPVVEEPVVEKAPAKKAAAKKSAAKKA